MPTHQLCYLQSADRSVHLHEISAIWARISRSTSHSTCSNCSLCGSYQSSSNRIRSARISHQYVIHSFLHVVINNVMHRTRIKQLSYQHCRAGIWLVIGRWSSGTRPLAAMVRRAVSSRGRSSRWVSSSAIVVKFVILTCHAVCGDGKVTLVDDCDGGAWCTPLCKCENGYQRTNPISTGCVATVIEPDTPGFSPNSSPPATTATPSDPAATPVNTPSTSNNSVVVPASTSDIVEPKVIILATIVPVVGVAIGAVLFIYFWRYKRRKKNDAERRRCWCNWVIHGLIHI